MRRDKVLPHLDVFPVSCMPEQGMCVSRIFSHFLYVYRPCLSLRILATRPPSKFSRTRLPFNIRRFLLCPVLLMRSLHSLVHFTYFPSLSLILDLALTSAQTTAMTFYSTQSSTMFSLTAWFLELLSLFNFGHSHVIIEREYKMKKISTLV